MGADQSDLLSLQKPDITDVMSVHEDINQAITELRETIAEQESSTVQTLENSAETLISSLRTCIEKAGVTWSDITHYAAGGFYADADAYALAALSEYFYEQHEEYSEIYDQIWATEQQLADEAEERKTEGVWGVITGVTLIAAGAACIFFTAGTATPIVVAGAVAGGGTALFGLADAVEGGYDIYYGSMGDVDSASINYLKSVVFQGNETAYQITESVFAFTASALVPIGAASKSATLTFRSGAVAVGKLAISDAAGNLTSRVILESTGNRAASMLAGMAASTVTGFGLNALDSKYHISAGTGSLKELKEIDTGDLHVVETRDPEVANKEWLERGYDNPPYDPAYEVKIVEAGDEKFSRVFSYNDDGTSNKYGPWLARKSDIDGLTAEQIADKLALPNKPTHICDVTLEPDFRLQTGVVNAIDGWGKGGILQFDTLGKKLPPSSFINERLIGE